MGRPGLRSGCRRRQSTSSRGLPGNEAQGAAHRRERRTGGSLRRYDAACGLGATAPHCALPLTRNWPVPCGATSVPACPGRSTTGCRVCRSRRGLLDAAARSTKLDGGHATAVAGSRFNRYVTNPSQRLWAGWLPALRFLSTWAPRSRASHYRAPLNVFSADVDGGRA